jgi:hypothetical protein
MALFTKDEIIAALTRLGELALERGAPVHLFAVGGTVIVLRYGTRLSTKDVDAVILAPEPARDVRELVKLVAVELDLPEDWLNDGAKGYVGDNVSGDVILQKPGIVVTAATNAHMLALKLWAWRDDIDISDAGIFLGQLIGTKDAIWKDVETYVPEQYRQKVGYAFEELWEAVHGSDRGTGDGGA